MLQVSGRLFAVETVWIEEAFALLDPSAKGFRPCGDIYGHGMDLSPATHTATVGGCEWELNSSRPRVSNELVDMIVRLILAIDTHDRAECSKHGQGQRSTSSGPAGAGAGGGGGGGAGYKAVLVFMPGFGEIQSLMRALEQWCGSGRGRPFVAVPSPGNIYVIQILQSTPLFWGLLYDMCLPWSRCRCIHRSHGRSSSKHSRLFPISVR